MCFFYLSSLLTGVMFMSEQDSMRLREILLNQRQEIFERIRRLESDWQGLGERDIELEEEAQKVDVTSLYSQLDDLEKVEIEEIDLALFKMPGGSYGLCEGCGKTISLKRLEALPAARLCQKCAHKYEEKQKRLPPAREVITAAELPAEYQDLNDKGLREVIWEHLRNDGRIDLEELEIRCRKGVLYLEGVIPSDDEHDILLQILTDNMGFEAIIDRLEINKLIWEREKRSAGTTEPELGSEKRKIYEIDELAEDVFESQEEEKPYMFPDRPPPEGKK
jgi:DnaK suppressor protein